MHLIHLIRHAQAEDRREWTGPDVDRPLTKKGRRQARAIAKWMESQLHETYAREEGPRETASGERARIVIRSSPAVRCVQTVEPLAAELGIELIVDESLMEGLPITLPRDEGIHIICAHGDNIPQLLNHLNVEWDECRKGSMWVLRMESGDRVIEARYIGPPEV